MKHCIIATNTFGYKIFKIKKYNKCNAICTWHQKFDNIWNSKNIYKGMTHCVWIHLLFHRVPLSENLRQPNTKKNNLTQQPQYDVNVELITH
jgi:hypothetical protein